MPIISTKTLKLLKPKEIEELYSFPRLEDRDRDVLFSLSSQEEEALSSFHTLPSKVLFILQLGLFKASRRFYSQEEIKKAEEDRSYIHERYFSNKTLEELSLKVSKPTRLSHQMKILELFGYRRCGGDVMLLVEQEASRLTGLHSKPSYIVRELFRFFDRENIIIPAYSTLQNLVGKAIQSELFRIEKLVDTMLSQNEKDILDELLDKRENFLYELTLLKRDPKDFSLKEIKATITKKKRLDKLSPNIEKLVYELKISDQNLLYYANLVNYYTVYKIARMASSTRRLLILCFIHVRYRIINDHLMKAFLYRVDKYINEAKLAVKEKVYRSKISYGKKLEKAGELLNLFINEKDLSDNTPFKDVREKVFSIIKKEELAILVSSLTEERIDEKALEWKQLEKMTGKIKLNLRPLILAISFKSLSAGCFLTKTIHSFQRLLQKGKPLSLDALPEEVFNKSIKKYIAPEGKIILTRYEFYLYRTLSGRMLSGDIFITNSLSYRSFDQDLVDKEAWKNRDSIISSLGLPSIKLEAKDFLNKLEKELSELYEKVNSRIISGNNSHIKFVGKNKEKWTLPYTKTEDSDKIDVFESIPPIGLSTLLNLVNGHCGFTDVFTHALGRYTKKNHNIRELLATITACGTNMGLKKMSRNSNVSSEQIHHTYRNFIRQETLKSACDIISDRISELPFFSDWHVDGEKVYSSSDGQKFGVTRNTYNARYSSKYFGLDKGVVSYTLNANHVPINARIIGANEHESHFVLDLLLDNTSEIRPCIHTTDSHGANRVNFALLHFFDYVFAPRYRNLPEEAKNIYCFENPGKYENYILSPKGKIDRVLIEEEWDNILRIIVSLATKTTSQSTIIRKLSSYPRKNNTRKALGELDKALKSIHVLRYVDDMDFRRHIQKALNRGESYHSLKRAIFYDNLGKFKVSSEYEQNIWSECSRLLALCIIYYNSFILSQLAVRKRNQGIKTDNLKNLSPIHWKHIDFFGSFYFSDDTDKNKIESVLTAIENLDFTLFSENRSKTT
jgi:TnpA family transposase